MDDINPYSPYLPSRQLTAILVLAVAILGGLYTYEKSKPLVFEGTKSGAVAIKEPTATLADIRERDSDGDGIKDWEEALWGTDPYLRDTDGNGKNDGEEIMARKEAIRKNEPIKADEKLTQTDILARDIFITTVALKQSGNYSPETVQALSSGVAEKIRNNPIPDKYTDKDIKLAKGDALDTATYGTAWLIIKKKYDAAMLGGEMYLLSEILNKNNEKAVAEIKRYVGLYKAFAADIMSLFVPPALAISQLQIANDAYAIAVALENASKLFSDPITGIIGLNQYKKETTDLIAHLKKIEEYYATLASAKR